MQKTDPHWLRHAPRPTPENTGEAKLYEPSISLAPERSLDLHGYTIDEALDALHRFFRECRGHGTLHVRIITGRGTGKLYRAMEEVLDEQWEQRWIRKVEKGEYFFVVVLET